MDCSTPDASHYAGCACNEEHWQDQVARLTRERDEARERAAGLSRELLGAMQARDSYRACAEIRVGMRREFEELLGCGDTTGEEAFERGLIRLRGLVAAEKELAEFSEILSRHNHEWSERCELAESRAARLAEAGAEFASQYGARAFDCRYDNSCDDSGREPRCAPCELRAAIAAEEGK